MGYSRRSASSHAQALEGETHAANTDSCSPVPATSTLKCVGSPGSIVAEETQLMKPEKQRRRRTDRTDTSMTLQELDKQY